MSKEPYSEQHFMEAVGWISAEMAKRADAWNGNAPDWFPEPPEWIELWDKALAATDESAQTTEAAFDAAIEAGERAHILTVGSPVRGLCLRVSRGYLSRSGHWHGLLPNVFLIWNGKRI